MLRDIQSKFFFPLYVGLIEVGARRSNNKIYISTWVSEQEPQTCTRN